MIEQLLDQLHNLEAQRAIMSNQFTDEKAAAIPAEITAKLLEIDQRASEALEACDAGIADLRKQITERVIENGQSVKSTFLHAVYTAGRVTWDSKKLDGYAAGHPEILAFRKQGEPSVSIRASK